ncbi:MAG: AAA family ATPase [Myxococcales bacterium]|nr:AAA family ATPase [Myxococcales bacterium]
MHQLPNYTIKAVLHEGSSTAILRGTNKATGASVVLKVPRGEYPTPMEIATFRQECLLLRSLNLPGVVKAYGIEKYGNGLALVLEDLQGQSLAALSSSRRLDLKTQLQIAVRTVEILGAIHDSGIIHRDVKPHNLIVDLSGPEPSVHFIDFGSACHMDQQGHVSSLLSSPEASLAYISPELTGRMSRSVDNRSDYYSLGVMLYELFTGTLPFSSKDPLDLVHSHIARTALPLHQLVPAVPEQVSRIILKLMAKAPEDRYHSAHGIRADLQRCLAEWCETGRIEAFQLAQRDHSTDLRLQRTLVGRSAELSALRAAFERSRAGRNELVLLVGPAGIGKSTLGHDLATWVGAQGGLFCSGRVEQSHRAQPYVSLLQALREVCQQLLTEPSERLDQWRKVLQEAVGQNGSLLCDLLPELELILGPQPELAQVGLGESQNRFHHVLQGFMRALSGPEHPLVLFFDDLQWVDNATLGMLGVLLADSTRTHTLVVAAYRDGEAASAHPLEHIVSELSQSTVGFTQLVLGPLSQADVEQLLVAALQSSQEAVAPLAAVIQQKTHGNPFFVHQFVLGMHREGLLRFDFGSESWQWNLAEIQARQVTDNVVTFTIGRIQLLSPTTQRALQLAACIGTVFDRSMLRHILQDSSVDLSEALAEAQRAGLCAPLEATVLADAHAAIELADLDAASVYRFLHDRVQQALYSLLPAAERPSLHRAIAAQQIARRYNEADSSFLFDLAAHLIQAAPLIQEDSQRVQAATVHLRAGIRAKRTAAHQAAAEYLQAGAALLSESSWTTQPGLSLELHVELAECLYLSGKLEQAEALFESLQPHLRDNLEHGRVAALRIELYATKGLMMKAMQVGLEALARFDLTFPEAHPDQLQAMPTAVGEFKELIGDRPIAVLSDLPSCVDPQQRMIQRLLLGACTPAFFVRPTLMSLFVMKLATLSLRHGNTEFTSYAHMSYAVIAANVLGNYAEAYEFGKMGLALNKKFHNVALECRLNGLFAGFVNIYQNPLHSSMEFLATGIEAGLQTGDFVFVGYCCFHTITQLLAAGDDLSSVEQEIDRLFVTAQRTREPFALGALTVSRQAIRSLQAKTSGPTSLSSPDFDEDKFVESFKQTEFTTLTCWYYTLKLMLSFLHGDYEAAARWAQEAQRRTDGTLGLHFVTDLHFFTCLALAAQGHVPGEDEGPPATLTKLSEQLSRWAACYPANFRHKHLLLQAELSRLRGTFAETLDLFDQAITAAQANEFVHHVALASELCARFLIKQGRSRLAFVYLRDAYHAYERWGATAKLAQMVQHFPELQRDPVLHTAHESVSPTISSSSTLTAGGALDIATVMHAAQSIASEIVLDRLLEQVLRLVTANAGAQRALLLLERDGQLSLEASMTVSPDVVRVGLKQPLQSYPDLAHSIVQLVAHTRESLILSNASTDTRHANDPYVARTKPKSVMCLALKGRGRLTGLVYLENNATEGAFTAERIELLRLLSGQAANAVENAILYTRLKEVSDQLQHSNDELRQKNSDLLQRTDELRLANERSQQELIERERIERERANLQEEVIRIQSTRLAEIAAPLIPITDQIMVLPLIGTMDTDRAQQVIHTVLNGAQQQRARVVIIDITGMKHVDTNIAGMLLNAASALRLLGTQAILTGIRAEIAQTLISLGIDLGGIVTRATLQSGIAYAASQRGLGGSSILGGTVGKR